MLNEVMQEEIKKYQAPVIEVVAFEFTDVIKASSPSCPSDCPSNTGCTGDTSINDIDSCINDLANYFGIY